MIARPPQVPGFHPQAQHQPNLPTNLGGQVAPAHAIAVPHGQNPMANGNTAASAIKLQLAKQRILSAALRGGTMSGAPQAAPDMSFHHPNLPTIK